MNYYSNPPYYLTAYGLAVKYGYAGTEQEFVDELLNGAAHAAEEAAGSAAAALARAQLAETKAEEAAVSAVSADASKDAAAASASAAAASEAAAQDYADHIADPVAGLVGDWLDEHVDPATGYVIDDSLSVTEAAADAKTTGDRLKSENRYSGALFGEDWVDFPDDAWEQGKAIDETGTEIESQFNQISPLIPITEGSYILLTTNVVNTSPYNLRIHGYDANGVWLRQINMFRNRGYKKMMHLPFTIQNDIAYIRFSMSIRFRVFGICKEPKLEWVLEKFIGAKAMVFDGSTFGYYLNDEGEMVAESNGIISYPVSVSTGWNTVLLESIDAKQAGRNTKVAGYFNGAFVRTLFKAHPTEGDCKLEFNIPEDINQLVVCMPLSEYRQNEAWVFKGKFAGGDYSLYSTLNAGSLKDEAIRLGLNEVPESVGVLNAIKRARQVTDINWKPAADVPRGFFETGDTYMTSHGDSYMGIYKGGVEYTGTPYTEENYVFSNFPVDALVTSAATPKGVQIVGSTGESSNHACYYGTVCSALTSYALNLPVVSSAYWTRINGMQAVGLLDNLTPEELRLADILQVSGHCAMITDFIRDSNGAITSIEISEATRQGNIDRSVTDGPYGGLSRRITMTVQDFYAWFEGFSVLRYAYLDTIPYYPNRYVPMADEGKPLAYINYPCVPYLGNMVSLSGEESRKIRILINSDRYTHMIVKRNGVAWNEDGTSDPYDITGLEEITISCSEGFAVYTACLATYSSGSIASSSVSCTWAIRPLLLPTVSKSSGKATFTFTTEGNLFRPWYVAFGTSSADTRPRLGRAIKVFDSYEATDNGNGTTTYTFTVDIPSGSPTHVRIGIQSDEFGSASKDVAF